MIRNFVKILELLGDRLEVCVSVYVTFQLAPELKKNNTLHLSNYSPLNEGHVNILTSSMLPTYTYDIDERIILR